MLPIKVIVAGLLAVAFVADCSKKKTTPDKGHATTPATVPTTATASQDIFDEFYKEDSSASKKATAPAPKSTTTSRSSVKPDFSDNGRFIVQVSTVRSRLLADEVASKLSAKGYPAYVAQVENPTPSLYGTYYRVRIGGFTGISAAKSFGENSLSAEGYEYWVDNRSNDNVGLQGGGMGSGDAYYSQPAPEQTMQPQATPAPASTYTPETASQEFQSSPAPAPAPATPATETKSEWGNEGW